MDPDRVRRLARRRDFYAALVVAAALPWIVLALPRSGAPPHVLEVRSAPWSGIDATLAASDLGCVLCHARIDGPRPVRVVCAEPYAPGVDADVDVVGTIECAPARIAAPDLVGALDAASYDAGVVEAARGVAGPGAADALRRGALGPVTLRGRVSGPVVLLGTEEQPIRLRGDAVIEGDLVVAGPLVGDGALRVFGNVYVPGDLVHRGSGGLRLLVRGSVLAGDALRPRRAEALAVTGGPDGSFSFLVEALARFNGRPDEPAFALAPDGPVPVLPAGRRATGEWSDPALTFAAGPARRVVGPGHGVEPAALWHAVERETGGPLGARSAGTRLDVLVVASGAFVAVAAGLDEWRRTGGTERDDRSVPSPSPGALRLEGALIATHAAVHAPAGLWIRDDPRARAAVRLPAARGLVARLHGPRASTERDGAPRTQRFGADRRSVPVNRSPLADRLLPTVAREPATQR